MDFNRCHKRLGSIARLGWDPDLELRKMLSALSTQLHARRVVLASQSPRRLELLRDCVRSGDSCGLVGGLSRD